MRPLITAMATLTLAATCFSQSPPIKKVVPADANAASGVEMFHSYCAACHGEDARGGGPAASALKKAPADLTLLSRKNAGKYPAIAVQNTIKGDPGTAAHGSRDMPVWGDLFKDMRGGALTGQLRVKNLSDYIEGLQQK
jgi:mono/diheme cytochrome c family protein